MGTIINRNEINSEVPKKKGTLVNASNLNLEEVPKKKSTLVNASNLNSEEVPKKKGTLVNVSNPNLREGAKKKGTLVNANNPSSGEVSRKKGTMVNPKNPSGKEVAKKKETIVNTNNVNRLQQNRLQAYEIYLENQTEWLSDDWEDEISFKNPFTGQLERFRQGAVFHGYEICKKLINKKHFDWEVGGESAGIYQAKRDGEVFVIKISRRKNTVLEELIHGKLKEASKHNNHIVTYFDAGSEEFRFETMGRNVCTYEIMEFCGTRTLEDSIWDANEKFSEKRLETEILPQMLEALRTMSEHNILHSDLKPENIVWNEKKNCYTIIDFGISRSAEEHASAGLDARGWTFDFKAPELSNPSMQTDKADFFSLGRILFVLLTGGYMPQWVLPEKENATDGRIRMNLKEYLMSKEYVENKSVVGQFSEGFAILYDGLTEDNYSLRYDVKRIEAWMNKQNILLRFQGNLYEPHNIELYHKMGEFWEEGKEFLFAKNVLKSSYGRDKVGYKNAMRYLNEALQKQSKAVGNSDLIFAEFLLNIQEKESVPILWYKGRNYLHINDYANALWNSLHTNRIGSEQELFGSEVLLKFYRRHGMERFADIEQLLAECCQTTKISKKEMFKLCYLVLEKNTFSFQGREYSSKKELFEYAKQKLKQSYASYVELCQQLAGNAEFEAWCELR